MTASTEQERAEFERTIGVDYDLTPSTMRQGQYAVPVTQAAWYGWQAARRAQVVPQGWRLVPEDPSLEMQQAALKYVSRQHQTRDAYAEMLAAAPQPPEATVKDCLQVAAPVQLPEPFAYVEHHKAGDNLWFDCPGGKYSGLYTEQQVRQILADHGIK